MPLDLRELANAVAYARRRRPRPEIGRIETREIRRYITKLDRP